MKRQSHSGLQLIRFPSVTRLQYQGEEIQLPSLKTPVQFRTSYDRFSNPPPLALDSAQRKFNLIQLPREGEGISIRTFSLKSTTGQSNLAETEGKNHLRKGKSVGMLMRAAKDEQQRKGRISLMLNTFRGQDGKPRPKIKSITLPPPVSIEEMYLKVIEGLALLNGGVRHCEEKSFARIKRAKVEVGNNGYIVKQMVKKRPWWNASDKPADKFNLIWTQSPVSKTRPSEFTQTKYDQSKQLFSKNVCLSLLNYPRIMTLFFTQAELIEMADASKQYSWNLQAFKSRQMLRKAAKIGQMLGKRRPSISYCLNSESAVIYNHIPRSRQLTDKKLLFQNLVQYCRTNGTDLQKIIPQTYHLTTFDWESKIQSLSQLPESESCQGWFLKPGENSNRGRGITVYRELQEALSFIQKNPPKGINKSYILQKSVKPLLYEGRKFDIRCFMLGVQVLGRQSFYWYEEGYVRTSSEKFSFSKVCPLIHLTNDAVQKQSSTYHKYESANKLSYSELEKYLKSNSTINLQEILAQMKGIALQTCRAGVKVGSADEGLALGAEPALDREGIYFQLFGLDFILQEDGQPFLLEVNTNPCLETESNLLSRVIPEVLENTFRIVLDVFLPSIRGGILAVPDWAESFLKTNRYSLLLRRQVEGLGGLEEIQQGS